MDATEARQSFTFVEENWAILFFIWIGVACASTYSLLWTPQEDVVTPYKYGQHGSPRSHRQIRECQPIKYGNLTHETQTPHGLNESVSYPVVTLKYIFDDFPMGERAPGHLAWANSPARTVSVLEPFSAGGCTNKHRARVDVTAKQENCLVAVNAGFFNTRQGSCYGNVISNGKRVQSSGGVQNAHFGIRADGTLAFGYFTEEDIVQVHNPFVQLVGGVGWLIRDGEIYVEESRKAECEETEETGPIDKFFDMLSARVAVGSDEKGRVVLAAIDGQSLVRGLSMHSFASWLLSHGVKNAINLDGGGSATFVINGTVANNPSDHCQNSAYRCPRQVSTVVCIHEPRCEPRHCNHHGDCIQGVCHCHGNWHGPECDRLECTNHNCSGHGQCVGVAGCSCDPGYLPPDCSRLCPRGWHGNECKQRCQCENGGTCDPVTGECSCLPGFIGAYCQQVCPLGYHGPGCQERCQCGDGLCPCHHITGSCNLNKNDSYYGRVLQASQCLADQLIHEEDLVPNKSFLQYELSIAFLIAVAIATTSIFLNLLCLCWRCRCHCSSPTCDSALYNNKQRVYRSGSKQLYQHLGSSDFTEEDEF